MSLKMRCEKCGEELDANLYTYLEHLRKHEPKKSKTKLRAFTGLYERYIKSLEFVIMTFVAGLIIFLLFALGLELLKNELIATPFDVSSDIKEFTGRTVAEILIDKINNRISSVPSSVHPEVVKAGLAPGRISYARESPLVKLASPEGLAIKMEVGGISFDSFVSYVRRVIRKETEVISGDVIKNGDDIKIIARTNKNGPWSEEGNENDLESINWKIRRKNGL